MSPEDLIGKNLISIHGKRVELYKVTGINPSKKDPRYLESVDTRCIIIYDRKDPSEGCVIWQGSPRILVKYETGKGMVIDDTVIDHNNLFDHFSKGIYDFSKTLLKNVTICYGGDKV